MAQHRSKPDRYQANRAALLKLRAQHSAEQTDARKTANGAPPPDEDDDEPTMRDVVEDIKNEVRAIRDEQARAPMPSTPQVIVVPPPRPSSDPPSRRGKRNWLPGIAAIITALGGAAGIQQCASAAHHAVPPAIHR